MICWRVIALLFRYKVSLRFSCIEYHKFLEHVRGWSIDIVYVYQKSTILSQVHMAAGAAAGIVEHTVMFPFDSVKTRLQSLCPCPEAKCPTPMHSLFSIIKRSAREGVFLIRTAGQIYAHSWKSRDSSSLFVLHSLFFTVLFQSLTVISWYPLLLLL